MLKVYFPWLLKVIFEFDFNRASLMPKKELLARKKTVFEMRKNIIISRY